MIKDGKLHLACHIQQYVKRITHHDKAKSSLYRLGCFNIQNNIPKCKSTSSILQNKKEKLHYHLNRYTLELFMKKLSILEMEVHKEHLKNTYN